MMNVLRLDRPSACRRAFSAAAAGLIVFSAPAGAQDAAPVPTGQFSEMSDAGSAATNEAAVRRVNASEVVEQLRRRRAEQGASAGESEGGESLLGGLLGLAADKLDDAALRRGLERAADGLIDRALEEVEGFRGRREAGANEVPGLAPLPSDEGEPGVASSPSGEGRRNWRDRGRDMLNTALGELLDRRSGESLSEWVARVVRETVDVILDEYLAYFKAEGRAYAKELGDQFVERVREDEKISRALFSVQALCWAVIAYLTLVTLLMLYWARRSSRRQELLLRELRELRREVGQR